MQKLFTFTRTLTVVILVLTVAAASASYVKSEDNDSTKCKRKCCKKNNADKELNKAVAEFNAALKELAAQLKMLESERIKTQFTKAVALAPVKRLKANDNYVVLQYQEAEIITPPQVESADQKIDFNNLSKEMNQVQEDMTQMDPLLKKADEKNRKAADDILKTGIKS